MSFALFKSGIDSATKPTKDLASLVSRIKKTPKRQDSLKVLIYSPVPWELGRFEIGIGLALMARGIEVTTFICGGGFSACEMENAKVKRPKCEDCVQQAIKQQECFGFTPKQCKEYISEYDRKAARKVAEEWDGHNLSEVTFEGMPVGLNVSRYFHNYYHAATFEQQYDSGHIENARRCLESSILYFVLARKVLAQEEPDILIMSNGKNLVYFPYYYHASNFRTRTITWDEGTFFPDSIFINENCFAVEVHLEKIWTNWKNVALTECEMQKVNELMDNRVRSINSNSGYIEIGSYLRDRGWDGIQPIISIFPNMAWDTAVVGRDVGFSSLKQWLHDLIDISIKMPTYLFVVRSHPDEYRLPRYYSTSTPVSKLLTEYKLIPPNMIVIPPETLINSYELGKISKERIVYSGTLGLEFPILGLSSLVCGDGCHRSMGFTVDIEDVNHLTEILNYGSAFSPKQQELAKRFMYLYVFRHILRLGVTNKIKNERFIPDYWFYNLLPGTSEYWDNFMEAIIGNRGFDFGPNSES